MLTTPFAAQRLSGKNDNNDLLRLVLFDVWGYWLALPIASVIKVIPCPPVISSNHQGIGLINLGHTCISVVDLHFRFSQKPLESKQFLILTFSQRREVFGIPTDRVPGMVEVPLENIVPLPSSYRQVDILGLASHMAVLEQEQESISIYLLDVGSFNFNNQLES
ncbi:MAG: hypothetical protein CV045_00560 [Cyanobacteria bacterium M5B4]|nr:MAG: hypothetical protein CV045_00560 [Cyanobacteria bacterium M5B4]